MSHWCTFLLHQAIMMDLLEETSSDILGFTTTLYPDCKTLDSTSILLTIWPAQCSCLLSCLFLSSQNESTTIYTISSTTTTTTIMWWPLAPSIACLLPHHTSSSTCFMLENLETCSFKDLSMRLCFELATPPATTTSSSIQSSTSTVGLQASISWDKQEGTILLWAVLTSTLLPHPR